MPDLPITLPIDTRSNAITKFLDAFELTRADADGEPKYYGYEHSDGAFVIVKHVTDTGIQTFTYYMENGAAGAYLSDKWADRGSFAYVEYRDLY